MVHTIAPPRPRERAVGTLGADRLLVLVGDERAALRPPRRGEREVRGLRARVVAVRRRVEVRRHDVRVAHDVVGRGDARAADALLRAGDSAGPARAVEADAHAQLRCGYAGVEVRLHAHRDRRRRGRGGAVECGGVPRLPATPGVGHAVAHDVELVELSRDPRVQRRGLGERAGGPAHRHRQHDRRVGAAQVADERGERCLVVGVHRFPVEIAAAAAWPLSISTGNRVTADDEAPLTAAAHRRPAPRRPGDRADDAGGLDLPHVPPGLAAVRVWVRQLDQLNIMSYASAWPTPGVAGKTWHSSALAEPPDHAVVGRDERERVPRLRRTGIEARRRHRLLRHLLDRRSDRPVPDRRQLARRRRRQRHELHEHHGDVLRPASVRLGREREGPLPLVQHADGPQRCTFISYENEQSLRAKGAYACSRGLGGRSSGTSTRATCAACPRDSGAKLCSRSRGRASPPEAERGGLDAVLACPIGSRIDRSRDILLPITNVSWGGAMATVESEHRVPGGMFAGMTIIDADTHLTEPHDLWTSRAPAGLDDRVPRVAEHQGQEVLDRRRRRPHRAGDGRRRHRRRRGEGPGHVVLRVVDRRHPPRRALRRTPPRDDGRAGHLGPDRLPERGRVRRPGPRPRHRRRPPAPRRHASTTTRWPRSRRSRAAACSRWRCCRGGTSTRRCAEIERAHGLGLRGINTTSAPHEHGAPDLGDPHWDPMWDACSDLGMPVNFHIGAADSDMAFFGRRRGRRSGRTRSSVSARRCSTSTTPSCSATSSTPVCSSASRSCSSCRSRAPSAGSRSCSGRSTTRSAR